MYLEGNDGSTSTHSIAPQPRERAVKMVVRYGGRMQSRDIVGLTRAGAEEVSGAPRVLFLYHHFQTLASRRNQLALFRHVYVRTSPVFFC